MSHKYGHYKVLVTIFEFEFILCNNEANIKQKSSFCPKQKESGACII